VALILNNAFRDVMLAVESTDPQPSRVARASRISTLITAAVALALSVSGPLLITVVFGSEYQDSALVMVILLVGIVVGNPGSIAGAGIAASGRPGMRSIALIVACVVNVALVVVTVPRWGAVGAASAMAAANLVAGMLMLHFARRQLGLQWRDFLSVKRADIAWIWMQLMQIRKFLSPSGTRLP
jgi:O-antigen/teichoic acid export membrane protein